MKKMNDLTGKRFGRLLVLYREENYISPAGWTQPQWECICDCGEFSTVLGCHLKKGNTRSCGCYRRDVTRVRNERRRKHATALS